MSIQTQIERIAGEVGDQKNLIAQISSVLSDKAAGDGGITPTGTSMGTPIEQNTIDLQALLEQAASLPNAGNNTGLPAGVSKMAAGSFTPAFDRAEPQTIQHNFGVKPDLVVVFADTGDADVVAGFDNCFLGSMAVSSNHSVNGTTYEGVTVAYYVSGQKLGITAAGGNLSEEYVLITPLRGNFKGGTTYHWIACVFG
jgi:hypothetical protein